MPTWTLHFFIVTGVRNQMLAAVNHLCTVPTVKPFSLNCPCFFFLFV